LFQPTRQQQQQRARRSIYTSSENEGKLFVRNAFDPALLYKQS